MKRVILVMLMASLLSSCASVATRESKARLKAITMPEVSFRAAHIRDVVGFLNSATRPAIRGPWIVLLLPHATTTDLVTLEMQDASLFEVAQAVAKLTDSRFYVKGGLAYLEPRNPRKLNDGEQDAMTDPFAQ